MNFSAFYLAAIDAISIVQAQYDVRFVARATIADKACREFETRNSVKLSSDQRKIIEGLI